MIILICLSYGNNSILYTLWRLFKNLHLTMALGNIFKLFTEKVLISYTVASILLYEHILIYPNKHFMYENVGYLQHLAISANVLILTTYILLCLFTFQHCWEPNQGSHACKTIRPQNDIFQPSRSFPKLIPQFPEKPLVWERVPRLVWMTAPSRCLLWESRARQGSLDGHPHFHWVPLSSNPWKWSTCMEQLEGNVS